jgi:hypothetical protein
MRSVLVAEDVGLADVGHAQQGAPDVLDVIVQLGERIAVGGECVNDSERVAELVVDERSLHAGRQRVLDVGNLLAGLVPRVGNGLGRSVVLQDQEDQRLARLRVAAREVEPGRLLQLLLESLGDLLLYLFRRRTRPQRAHHHDLERELRVLTLPEPHVGVRAGSEQRQDEVQDQRLMLERPLRQIESRDHRAVSGSKLTRL